MSKKIPICFLVIDNDQAQQKIVENEVLTKLGAYDITYNFFNPKDYITKETDFRFNEDKFIDDIREFTKGKILNLIASDYNLGGTLKGIDLINLIKTKVNTNFKNCLFIIHSGNLKDASERLLQKIFEQKENSGTIDIGELNNVIETRIRFVERKEYPREIVSEIKENQDIKSIIISTLNKIDLTINCGNADFDGLKTEKLVELITLNDIKGQRFIQEFSELAIAHYSKINE